MPRYRYQHETFSAAARPLERPGAPERRPPKVQGIAAAKRAAEQKAPAAETGILRADAVGGLAEDDIRLFRMDAAELTREVGARERVAEEKSAAYKKAQEAYEKLAAAYKTEWDAIGKARFREKRLGTKAEQSKISSQRKTLEREQGRVQIFKTVKNDALDRANFAQTALQNRDAALQTAVDALNVQLHDLEIRGFKSVADQERRARIEAQMNELKTFLEAPEITMGPEEEVELPGEPKAVAEEEIPIKTETIEGTAEEAEAPELTLHEEKTYRMEDVEAHNRLRERAAAIEEELRTRTQGAYDEKAVDRLMSEMYGASGRIREQAYASFRERGLPPALLAQHPEALERTAGERAAEAARSFGERVRQWIGRRLTGEKPVAVGVDRLGIRSLLREWQEIQNDLDALETDMGVSQESVRRTAEETEAKKQMEAALGEYRRIGAEMDKLDRHIQRLAGSKEITAVALSQDRTLAKGPNRDAMLKEADRWDALWRDLAKYGKRAGLLEWQEVATGEEAPISDAMLAKLGEQEAALPARGRQRIGFIGRLGGGAGASIAGTGAGSTGISGVMRAMERRGGISSGETAAPRAAETAEAPELGAEDQAELERLRREFAATLRILGEALGKTALNRAELSASLVAVRDERRRTQLLLGKTRYRDQRLVNLNQNLEEAIRSTEAVIKTLRQAGAPEAVLAEPRKEPVAAKEPPPFGIEAYRKMTEKAWQETIADMPVIEEIQEYMANALATLDKKYKGKPEEAAKQSELTRLSKELGTVDLPRAYAFLVAENVKAVLEGAKSVGHESAELIRALNVAFNLSPMLNLEGETSRLPRKKNVR